MRATRAVLRVTPAARDSLVAVAGILFVDEAYTLVSDDRDSFGKEALDTLMKGTEDHRDDLVVILAVRVVKSEIICDPEAVRFPGVAHADDVGRGTLKTWRNC